MRRGFIIAALASGSGKTTVTTGLMRALSDRGHKVMPFKVGPDYIDTRFHSVATGEPSVNLDIFFSGREGVAQLFDRYSRRGDISVIEGVMGLFDGYDRDRGSAAEIAMITGLPVVMVVNACSAGYSLAAVLKGVKVFNPDIRIAGVIFNNVGSDRHLSLLKAAAEDSGIPMLGYVRRDKRLVVPSRHLGLKADEYRAIEEFAEISAGIMNATVRIDRLWELHSADEPYRTGGGLDPERGSVKEDAEYGEKIIAVAKDDAFRFIYPENIESLRRDPKFGGRIVYFSPLEDESLPDADFIYLPGGYPELYKERLAGNKRMIFSLKNFVEAGGYIWAECGGLLYLCRDIDGVEMCGILPLSATMKNKHLTLGYRRLLMGGKEYRGHEFHYSEVMERGTPEKRGCQYDINGMPVSTPLYSYKNLLAGYTHIYWGEGCLSDLWENR